MPGIILLLKIEITDILLLEIEMPDIILLLKIEMTNKSDNELVIMIEFIKFNFRKS